MDGIYIPIIISLGAFTMVVLLRYYTFLERKVLAEKGVDLVEYNRRSNRRGDLRAPFLFMGVAVGLLLGNVLSVTTPLNTEVCYFSMSFLLGGVGLVGAYFYHKREDKEHA